jgi:hypothetical protein
MFLATFIFKQILPHLYVVCFRAINAGLLRSFKTPSPVVFFGSLYVTTVQCTCNLSDLTPSVTRNYDRYACSAGSVLFFLVAVLLVETSGKEPKQIRRESINSTLYGAKVLSSSFALNNAILNHSSRSWIYPISGSGLRAHIDVRVKSTKL